MINIKKVIYDVDNHIYIDIYIQIYHTPGFIENN